MNPSEKPWLQNKKWRSNQIRSSAKIGLIMGWLIAVIWCLFCIPILINLDKIASENEPLLWLFPTLFPLIGVALLISASKKSAEWKRFGPTPLSLSPFPGSIGGDVGGSIQVSLPLPNGVEFKITLTNLYTYTRGSGKNRSTKHDVVWQDSQTVIPDSELSGSQINFKFPIPSECRDSQPSNASGYHHWTLEVESTHPTIKLARSYEIPVYQLDAPQQSEIVTQLVADNLQNAEFVQSVPQTDGLSMHYPMFRNLSFNLVFSMVGLIFTAVGLFLIFGENDGSLFMGMIFFILGAFFALFGLHRLGLAYRVKVDMQGVHLEKQWFTWRWYYHFPIDQIKSFRKKQDGQSSSGNKVQVYYRIELVNHQDKATTIGDAITSASQADQLIAQIEAALNGATLADYN